jgi:hypothetical protein
MEAKAKAISAVKAYPDNYSKAVTNVIEKIAFNKGKDAIPIGSASLRSQQYAGDIDINQFLPKSFMAKAGPVFQTMIRDLLNEKDIYIGDIKCGYIDKWLIVEDDVITDGEKVLNMQKAKSLTAVRQAVADRALSEKEGNEAIKLIEAGPTPTGLFRLREIAKIAVLRWTPKEILDGKKELVNGKTITLQEAINTDGLFKLDIVAWIAERFIDLSIIYFFSGSINAKIDEETKKALADSFYEEQAEGNYYKACKRLFALSLAENIEKPIVLLNELFNSDYGRLYLLKSDLTVIEYLLENIENVSVDRIKLELDNMRARFGLIYDVPEFLRAEPTILGRLLRAEKLPETAKGKQLMLAQVKQTISFLSDILNKGAKEFLNKHSLI